MPVKTISTLILAFVFLNSFVPTAVAQTRSLVIRNARVVDGSGKPSFTADLRLDGDRIVKIGRIKPGKDEEMIDASGLVLSPGFIDIHNHSEAGLLRDGQAPTQVSQGITTVIVGPDGGSPASLKDYFAKLEGKIAVNVGAFMGHGTLRQLVMNSSFARKTTEAEIEDMKMLLTQAMLQGSFGLSSGLEYDTGYSASTEEMIALAKIAAKHNGIYMTHMRDEEEGMLDALREAIRIGREAGLPVQISHIKMGNKNMWGKSAEAIALVEETKKSGFDISADAYPYTAWASTITVLVPSRKHEDRGEIEKGLNNVGGADKVLITNHAGNRSYEMRTMSDIASSKNISPVDLYIEIVKNGGAAVVCNSMNEGDVKAFYTQPWVMVSSDGGIGSRHPRGAGTFTRVLSKFVRDEKWFGLEEAVRKMSSMPAARLGLKDRGLVKKGMKADLVLFDPAAVADRSTFAEPANLSEGVKAVFVNGSKVWENGKTTGHHPGVVLRRK